MRSNPRPVENGRELRWRWWLMRVNLERQSYVFVEDVERFDWATLFADAGAQTCGGDFIVWDAEEKKPAYDTRKTRCKWEDDRPTVRDLDKTPAT